MGPDRPLALALLLAGIPWSAAGQVREQPLPGLDGGHAKLIGLVATYPDDSLFREELGSTASDQYADLRLNFAAAREHFGIQADYQLLAQAGDSLRYDAPSGDFLLLPPGLPDDDLRWWDLTDNLTRGGSTVAEQRLDRLSVGYTGERLVLRLGRQAVSWGNGLIYNPADFFNPFNPAAIDTEYKQGDDMAYGQYLLQDGSDWQSVFVQRRDEAGRASSAVQTAALKYHGFGLDWEYDLTVAKHFNETVLGIGGVANAGESVVRGDLVMTEGKKEWVAGVDLNWSYSWVLGGHNVSAVAEYFYNGFGLREKNYTAEKLQRDVDLTRRLRYGELYNIGRQYLAGSLLVEVSPLLDLTPNLFLNLLDHSVLGQLVLQWSLHQDWQLLAAVTAPFGSKGTEYGGLETGVDDLTLEAGPSLYAELAWYF